MIIKAQQLLKNIFGYETFLPLQKEVISHTLSGKDALAVMPTGGGKSLCYQLPALMRQGITIVISPLISLMKDQVDQLREFGVQAVCLNSSLPRTQYQKNVAAIKEGKAKLLYVAPETLLMETTLNLLKSIKVDCFTIDEAHCISEWGHDFRPEYRQIASVRKDFPHAVCLALTATATPRVQKDISSNLNFKDSDEFITSFNRDNLFLEIASKTDPYSQVTTFLQKFKDQSGIIYCLSRKQVDDLALDLEAAGYSVKPYHAGLSQAERNLNQELFIKDDIRIIVATIAFGMGINKPDVRFVIHHDLPKNIESYYQQIGRAGRDGLRSHCLLLFSYGDLSKISYFIKQMSGTEQRIARQHLDQLVTFAEAENCRRVPLLAYFGETYQQDNCGMCDNCQKPARQQIDITIPVQKFLSCLVRTGQRFGLLHIIDILRGSKAKKILKLQHDKLSVYGIGTDLTKKQWSHISRQLTSKHLIFIDQDFGSIKLTESGNTILKNRVTVLGTLIEDSPADVKSRLSTLDYNDDMFEILKTKRKQLADQADVPPYVIFSDKSLIEMSTSFPGTEAAFLQIHGVGRIKLQKYGKIFLDLIQTFCQNNKMVSSVGSTGFRPSLKKLRFIDVSESYNDGLSVSDLMSKWKVKQATITAHLYRYLESGLELRPDGIAELNKLPLQEQELIFKAFDELGCKGLAPIFEKFKEQIPYDELHLQRLCYLVQKG